MGLIYSTVLFAQLPAYEIDSAFLDVNDLSAAFNSGGDISWDLIGNPRYEVPKGGGTHALFAGNLWIGGLDGSGQLRMAAQTYKESGGDYWSGPVADTYDSAYFARYSRVWKVNENDVAAHQISAGMPGYSAPADLKDWPGNGDTTNGEPFLLAPFEDLNNNQIYEPDSGEYPLFHGDQVLYMISNDKAAIHAESGGQALGVDIHLMAYAFDRPASSPLDQTIFLSYRIVNRSQEDFHQLMTGLWLDLELGALHDDFIGCDTASETFYVYNGDSLDHLTAYGGYGTTPPAFGATFLNQSMSYFRTYDFNESPTGRPFTASDFYGYLRNYWKDSTLLTVGGDGSQGGIPINYAFPGNVLDTSQWSEVSEQHTGSDRRGVGSIGPFTLGAGEEFCMDVALVFGRAISGNHLSSVPVMLGRVRDVRTFYEANPKTCELYQASSSTALTPEQQNRMIEVYPNPATSHVSVQLPESHCQILLYDIEGKVLEETFAKDSLLLSWEVKDWPAGIYFIDVRKGEQSWSGKFVKN